MGIDRGKDERSTRTSAELRRLLAGDTYRHAVRELVGVCGGLGALVELDVDPLTERDDDRTVPPGRAGRLQALIEETLVPSGSDAEPWRRRLDDELRLAIRRFVRRGDVVDAVESHRSSDARLAAALVWIVGRGNGDFSRIGRGRPASDLWFWFRVSDSSKLARSLAASLGLVVPEGELGTTHAWTPIRLGDPALLVEVTRRRLVEERDVIARLVEQALERQEQQRPLRPVGGGQLQIRARPTRVESAMKLEVDGRQSIALFVGGQPGDPEEILSMSVPDAHLLVQRVSMALTGSATTGRTPT